MDVQADEAGLRPDPSVTAIVERPVTDSQGQLFRDAYPTYADTDKIPAVGRRTARAGPGPVAPGPGCHRGAGRGGRRCDARSREGRSHRHEQHGQPERDPDDDAPPRGQLADRPAGEPGLDRERHRHLPDRHCRLRGDRHHVDRPLLGEHRGGGKASDLRGRSRTPTAPRRSSSSVPPRSMSAPVGPR